MVEPCCVFMKPIQSSPVSATMQDAYGCAVENRFMELPDDCDPLDLLYQASVELTQRKKKEEAAAKKAAKQKGNKKESQKDRKVPVVPNVEPQSQKRPQKQTLQMVPQNENVGSEVKVERNDRRMAFKEFRPNIIEKPMEYSIDNRIRAEDKRGGSGPRNWGSFKDALSEEEPAPVENVETTEQVETIEEEQDAKVPDEIEDYAKEMSLDEWKSMLDQNRSKAELKLRKPDAAMPSKAVVIHKSKYKENAREDEEEYNFGFRRSENDITSKIDINFGNLPRPGRGGRGGGRGRVRREEPFPHEVPNVNDFALNPDDPNDFPALC